MSFEEAKQFLRREDEDGSSLYEHLSQVLAKIVVEKPANANAMFEHISQELRRGDFANTVAPAEGDEEPTRPEKEAQLAWCATVSKLYEDKTGEEQQEGTFPDLMTEANVYEWAGISFGREETYRLYLSIKSMALQEGRNLRFWGKVLTQSGDYYIIQSENSTDPPSPDEVHTIEGVEGANKYAFWVCKHAGGEWTQLPNVTPASIVVARQIKRLFTGDIHAKVPSYPPFPGGSEAHLLRAQIALITSECSISPDGFFQEDDEAAEGIKSIKKVDEVEEYKTMDELKDASNWKHHELPINVNGRCNQPPQAEEEADGAVEDAPELPDMPILAAAAEDEPAWRIEACPGGPGESPDSIVIAKSLKWPGAVAAAFGNKFINVYCGFGYSSNRGVRYEPPPVAPIQQEWTPGEDMKDLVEDEDKITAPVIETEGDEDET